MIHVPRTMCQPTTPEAVYTVLVEQCAVYHIALAEEYATLGTVDDESEAGLTEMQDVLSTLQVALYGEQGRGPDAELLP